MKTQKYEEANPAHPAISNELLEACIRIFGLEGKRVTAITLRLEWNQFARMTIERAPLNEDVRALVAMMEGRRQHPGSDDRIAVDVVTVPSADADGHAVQASGRIYPGPEEIAIEEVARTGRPVRPEMRDDDDADAGPA